MSAVAQPTPGRPRPRIGKYLITGRIGRGGMGVVYRGRDELLERDVAVKTLSAEGTLDEESRARFGIEAKAAARLQHPNIVTIFELGEDRGLPFIAMELLPGADLETLLRSGEEMLLEERLDVVQQVGHGLAFAHQCGVVHRDMKPSNVRVLDDGRAKIMDFGIAKLGTTGVTRSGMMVGTVHYMSPEQIRGGAIDGRSDVFSLGVILYELLTGQRPFPGQDMTQVLYRIAHQPHPPLAGDWGALTPRLRAIVDQALAKDPEQRHAGAGEFADGVAGVLHELRHARARTSPPPDAESLAAARRLLGEGRSQESLEHLRALVARHPDDLEARRALRTAQRAATRPQPIPLPADDFPELDPTFNAPPTERATTTLRSPVAETTPAARPRRHSRLLLAGAAVALVSAVTALLIHRAWRQPGPELPPSSISSTSAASAPGSSVSAGPSSPSSSSSSAATSTAPTSAARPAAGATASQAAGSVQVQIQSEPSGAVVLVDGRDSGLVTDGELTLPARDTVVRLTLRKPGYADLTHELHPPLTGQSLHLSLRALASTGGLRLNSVPAGAQVTLDGQARGRTPLTLQIDPLQAHTLALQLDGYEAQEIPLAAGAAPPELNVSLTARGPFGTVTVRSSYPLDVLWQGRVLAKDQVNPSVSVAPGNQTLTLIAPQYFLKTTVNVQIEGAAAAAVEAPGLGTLNVRATPDNCEVLIGGVFADYPPILNRKVAAGTLTVTFKWRDGTRRDETVTLAPGAIQYVTGRKD